MKIKKIVKIVLFIFIFIFLSLTLIAIGVKYESSLNEWNNKVIKGEEETHHLDLYLNNYSPVVTTWDLSDKLGEKKLTTNQYGKEVFLGGLITGARIEDGKIDVAFNSGLILNLSEDGRAQNKILITPLLKDFVLDYSNGGIRSFLWLDSEIIFVYYTSKNQDNQEYFLRAALIDIKNMLSKDDIILGKFSNSEHFALGGGSFYDKKNNSIYIAIGAAAGADNLISNAKAQDDNSFFGKVIKLSIPSDKFKLLNPTIFSKGHRNPQGMVSFDNKIFAVEHGPKGGDEINLLLENGNYGWNKFSYGTKYGKADQSYSNYSSEFIDPIFYFTPSIGISDIYPCPEVLNDPGYKDCLLISSMRDKSFYIAKLNHNKDRIIGLERVSLGNRIRKIRSSEKSVFLFTDDQSILKINYVKL